MSAFGGLKKGCFSINIGRFARLVKPLKTEGYQFKKKALQNKYGREF